MIALKTFQQQEEFTENADKFSYRKKNWFSSSIPYLRITAVISPTTFSRSVTYRAILMLFECHVILTSNSSWSWKVHWKKPQISIIQIVPRLPVGFLFHARAVVLSQSKHLFNPGAVHALMAAEGWTNSSLICSNWSLGVCNGLYARSSVKNSAVQGKLQDDSTL